MPLTVTTVPVAVESKPVWAKVTRYCVTKFPVIFTGPATVMGDVGPVTLVRRYLFPEVEEVTIELYEYVTAPPVSTHFVYGRSLRVLVVPSIVTTVPVASGDIPACPKVTEY